MTTPRCLSNPQRCSKYILNIINEYKWNEFDGLILFGFQELWTWNTGIIPSFIIQLISYIEYIPILGRIISIIFQIILLILGLIFRCSPIKYNPKTQVINKLKHALPYHYYDNRIPFCPLYKQLDNGLLILSNVKPTYAHSILFKSGSNVDNLAAKGALLAYFEDWNILFITTHLQSAGTGKERIEQITEIKQYITVFSDQYKIPKNVNIIIAGDLNVDMTIHNDYIANEGNDQILIDLRLKSEKRRGSKKKTYQNLPKYFGDNFNKINSCNPTLIKKERGNLDQVFVNFPVYNYTEIIMADEPNLSDHLMVISDFHINRDS